MTCFTVYTKKEGRILARFQIRPVPCKRGFNVLLNFPCANWGAEPCKLNVNYTVCHTDLFNQPKSSKFAIMVTLVYNSLLFLYV